jgi:hypothetical protein
MYPKTGCGDWRALVRERARRLGFDTVTQYAVARVGVSFIAAAWDACPRDRRRRHNADADAELERRLQLALVRAERAARRLAGETSLPTLPELGRPAVDTPGPAPALALRLTPEELVWSVGWRADRRRTPRARRAQRVPRDGPHARSGERAGRL